MITLLVMLCKVFFTAVIVCAVWLNNKAEQTAKELEKTEKRLQQYK